MEILQENPLDKRELDLNQSGRIPGIGWGVDLGVNLRFSGYIWDPDIALRQDEQFYERIERDAIAAHAMMELRTLVAGSGWSVHVTNQKYAPIVPMLEAWLDNIEGFQQAKQNLCHAIIRGTHASRVVGGMYHDYQITPGDKPRSWYLVDSLLDRDKRGLKIVWERVRENEPDSEINRRYHYAVLDPINQRWYKLKRNNYVIWAFNQTQTSSLYGHGIGNALYIPVYVVNQLEDIELQAYDAYTTGIKKISIDMEKGMMPSDTTDEGTHQTPEDRGDDLLEQVSKMSENGHAVIVSKWKDGGDDFEVMWSQPGMFDSLEKAIKRKRDEIQITILGSAVLGETGGQGSRARAETQSRMGDRRIQSYRRESDDVWQKQLIQRMFWEQNSHIWQEMGLWIPRCPLKVKTNRWVDYDPKEEIDNMKILVADLGLEISAETARDRAGYPEPKPGEKILKPPPMPGQTAPSVDGSGKDVTENSISAQAGTIVPEIKKEYEWSEEKHPRDDGGKFASTPGGGGGGTTKPKKSIGQKLKDVGKAIISPKKTAKNIGKGMAKLRDKMEKPLVDAGYSPRAARTIATAAAVLSGNPITSISRVVALTGLAGPAGPFLAAAPMGQVEAGAVYLGALLAKKEGRPVAKELLQKTAQGLSDKVKKIMGVKKNKKTYAAQVTPEQAAEALKEYTSGMDEEQIAKFTLAVAYAQDDGASFYEALEIAREALTNE